MNLRSNRSYTYSFRHDYLMILIQYHQLTILQQLPLNFISIQKYIKEFRLTSKIQLGTCILKYYHSCNLFTRSEISFLLLSQVITFSLQNKDVHWSTSRQRNNSSQSNVIFLENRLTGYTSFLKGTNNRYLHPEILVRILRPYKIDICTIHTLRELLYSIPSSLAPSIENVYHQCYNHLFIEYDFFLQRYCQKLSIQLKTKKWFARANIAKWKTSYFQTIIPVTCSLVNCYKLVLDTVSYCRYHNNYLLALGGTTSVEQLSYKRLIRFAYRRLSYPRILMVYKDQRLYWQQWLIQTQYKLFYGYPSSLNANPAQIRIVLKSFVIICPTHLLLKKLSDYGICTQNGYPIINRRWIRWNDAQIVHYFQLFYQHYYWIYSGTLNSRMKLKYTHYLIRYACAKTLAFKHKTNLSFIIQHNRAWNQMQKMHLIRVGSGFNYLVWHLDTK